MRLSVVIPFYNARDTLPRCLDAVLAQRYPRREYEVIAIDNDSTDGSADIVRRYPEVLLLREERRGAYIARNRGVAASCGEILVFTDPDCVADEDWLQRIDTAMEAEDTHVVIGGYVLPERSTGVRLLLMYENTKDAFVFGTDIPELYYAHTNNMAVRRETFDRFGPFVERRRGSDTIFVRRLVEALPCRVVRYDPGARVEHLEVADVRTYFRKMATYGESRESYRHLSWTRPLSLGERARVLLRAVREHGLSPAQVLLLVCLLSAGLLAWRMGRLSAQRRRFTSASAEIAPLSSRTAPEPDR